MISRWAVKNAAKFFAARGGGVGSDKEVKRVENGFFVTGSNYRVVHMMGGGGGAFQ
jgi:hypothetical protein